MNGTSPPSSPQELGPPGAAWAVSLKFFLLCLLCGTVWARGAGPRDAVRNFTAAVNHRDYRLAYSYISKPLQEKMSFGDFHDAAERVKHIRIASIRVFRQTDRIAKARVVVEDIEKDADDTSWQKRKHSGVLVFILENGRWRVIQVYIKRGGSKGH